MLHHNRRYQTFGGIVYICLFGVWEARLMTTVGLSVMYYLSCNTTPKKGIDFYIFIGVSENLVSSFSNFPPKSYVFYLLSFLWVQTFFVLSKIFCFFVTGNINATAKVPLVFNFHLSSRRIKFWTLNVSTYLKKIKHRCICKNQ